MQATTHIIHDAHEVVDCDLWQFEQMRELGLTVIESLQMLVSERSWHDVASLLDRGCLPELAVKILATDEALDAVEISA